DFGRLKNRLAFTLSDVNRDNFANPAAIAPDFFSRGRSERFEYRGDWSLNETIRAVVGAEHERSRFNDGFLDTGVNVTSGYVQLVLNPFSRLTLTGGVRLDDHETWGSDTTFSANAAWRPTDNLVVRAAYGEGFKAPTLYQLYSFYGDPTLKPERAQSWEVGVEQWLLDRRVRLGLTGWQRRTRSQIDFDLFFFRYNNIARSRGKGIEAEIELRPTDRFSLSAIYSYSDSEGRQDNEATYHRLLRRPVHSLNLAMDWNAYGKVKLGADVKLVGDSIDGFGGSERLDGFALAAVRASAPLGHGLELYGRVENIFDTTYQTVAGYKAYGRNAHIGVRMKF
ncbi:TonB-dependent receptor plug domain-containing protein, partial [Sphingorhabdus sp.]